MERRIKQLFIGVAFSLVAIVLVWPHVDETLHGPGSNQRNQSTSQAETAHPLIADAGLEAMLNQRNLRLQESLGAVPRSHRR